MFSFDFFDRHPLPMWMKDPGTGCFLNVNQAALDLYGYSHDEFLSLPALDLQAANADSMLAGIQNHRAKSGDTITVRVTTFLTEKNGIPVEIVSATPVGDLISVQQELTSKLERETTLRFTHEGSATILQAVLEAIPAKLIVLSTRNYAILAVTEDFLSVIGAKRSALIGRPLFEVFPDIPGTANGVAMISLRESLERVEQTRQPDTMALQFFALNGEAWVPGSSGTRFWSSANWPVLGPDGSILFFIHQAEDVTELVKNDAGNQPDLSSPELFDQLRPDLAPAFLRSNELKSANLRLQEQAANLRTAKRLLGIGIWRMNLTTHKLTWSEKLDDIYDTANRGISYDFDGYVALLHPQDQAAMIANYERFRKSGDLTFQFNHRILRRDGRVAFVAGIAEVAETLDGPVLTGVVQDITERETMTAQMRLLSASLARINDIILISDAEPLDAPDGPRIIYANDAFVRQTGFSLEEIIGKTPRILQGPLTQPGELERIGTALRSWKPVRSELINYKKNGEPFWLELDIVPIADETGWYTHWISVERDITARKHDEAERNWADDRFRLLTQATNDVIWDWDMGAGKIWWNSNYTSLFGYPADTAELGPASWFDHIHPGDQPRIMKSLGEFIWGKKKTWSADYRFLTADNEVRWVRDRSLILRDSDGRAMRMIGSISDYTELKELSDRLRQTERLEAIGRLTGGFAHDFNNLLTVILGNAETLSDRLPDGPLREMAQLSLSASITGADLIRRLLAFASNQPLDPKAYDLNHLTAETLALIRRALPDNVSAHLVQDGELWKSLVDGPQLQAALMNLCVNARDAMPEGGSLTLKTENVVLADVQAGPELDIAAGDYVVLSVTDTGVGMAPDTLTRVFEPFFTTKPTGEGSGLGLSMVYGFVKQTGGNIRISSELDVGTSVSLYFPRWIGELTSPADSAPPAGIGFPGLHVLVVEDNEQVMVHVCRLIQELGMSVSKASSSEEALTVLDMEPGIELLFTDIVLPGRMNGVDLARAARSRKPGLRVLFTSGYTRRAVGKNGLMEENIHLLSKPYRRQDLEAKLREVLGP